MDEDPKMSEMTPRGRKTAVVFEPQDWVALGWFFWLSVRLWLRCSRRKLRRKRPPLPQRGSADARTQAVCR
jgi:hypothetical protein